MTHEEAQKIMEVPGRAGRGVFATEAQHIRAEKGEKGLLSVEKKIEELGFPLNYGQIKTMEWYPLGLRVLSLLCAKEVFSWGDEEIKEMGRSAPKYSFIVKMVLKYFSSLQRTFMETTKYWERHYSVGRLEPGELREKEKWCTIRLKGFKIHPVLCNYFNGYFFTFVHYVIRSEEMEIKETKCMFKGDSWHEFLFTWK